LETGFALEHTAERDLSNCDFDRKHYQASQPVLITDGAAECPALRNWTSELLEARLPNKTITVNSNERGVFIRNKPATTGSVERRRWPFSKAVELTLLDQSAKYYIQQQSIETAFPELLPDVARPHLLDPGKRIRVANVWFGGSGCKTPLHYDRSHNFLAQIFGKKRITMFSPSTTRWSYPALEDVNPHTSKANIFLPDLIRFPLLAGALSTKIECEIAPGNILYIPIGWWHAGESIEVSVSVNIWWDMVSEPRSSFAGNEN